MASIEDDADEPAEESLISAVLHFKIGQPQATAKEIHAALASKDPVSLADVKKAASKAMKKLALGGTTAASGVAVAIGSATAVDSSSALCFMPFAPGSVVTNLDGLKCKVLKTKADGRVAVVTEQRQKLEIPHEQLVLIDTPRNTCPTGYELIVQSPLVGRIDQCHELAEIIAERAAPPHLLLRPWESFDAMAQRCGGAIECMITRPEVALCVPPGMPPTVSKMVCFALDAVAQTISLSSGASAAAGACSKHKLTHKVRPWSSLYA